MRVSILIATLFVFAAMQHPNPAYASSHRITVGQKAPSAADIKASEEVVVPMKDAAEFQVQKSEQETSNAVINYFKREGTLYSVDKDSGMILTTIDVKCRSFCMKNEGRRAQIVVVSDGANSSTVRVLGVYMERDKGWAENGHNQNWPWERHKADKKETQTRLQELQSALGTAGNQLASK